jgi:ATP-binding cassette subfamily F protein 3
MSVLILSEIGQTFGDFDVFSGLSARLERDGKAGLVGPNGVGKTTLLRIIAGLEEPKKGTLTVTSGINIGYLRQEAVEAFAAKTNTLIEEMLSVFEPVKRMEARMREIEAMMTDGSAGDAEFEEYGNIQENFDRLGGYDYEHRIDRTLHGLGFGKDDWNTPLIHLSGGQKTRALLARLLLSSPDLLILDEPTNHLDVEAIQWLEGTLKMWDGALLIVSHDRYFLDKVVNNIWELTHAGLETYKGNYSSYVQQRQHNLERLEKEWEQMIERFTSELAFIEKQGMADTNAAGRFKVLARQVQAVKDNGVVALRVIKQKGWLQFTEQYALKRVPETLRELRSVIRSLEHPIKRQKQMRIKLTAQERSGEIVLRTSRLTIGYPTNTLFVTDRIELARGDVVALIGGNGAGKSTFLKTLMSELQPLQGQMTPGINVQMGYFAQAHDTLNPDNTVLDELRRQHHKELSEGDARHVLAQYLFRGDDVYKTVNMLSGGERGRLSLAILSTRGANFLLLDEPTNHLDIPAQEILQEVLEDFTGTILLVSHDRYIVNRLATQIWHVRDGHLHIFNGNYQDFLAYETARLEAEKAKPKAAKPKQQRNDTALKHLETQINSLETSLNEMALILARASANGSSDDVQRLSKEYAAQKSQLESLEAEWESAAAAEPA